MNNFGIGTEQMDRVIATALAAGGDWCDLYFEDMFYGELLLRDGEVGTAELSTDYGCGVRVLKGEKTGYAYTESTDLNSLTAAAKSASSIAFGNCRSMNYGGFKLPAAKAESHYAMQNDWRQASVSNFIPVMKKIDGEIRRRESRVEKVIVSLSYSVCEIMMYNSLYELCTDTKPLGSISVSVVFRNGKRTETNNASLSVRAGAEFLSDSEIEDLISRAISGVDELFAARRPKGGQMSVVMKAGAAGILLHEAMGHAFEADFNRKGQSIFADKMGRRICKAGIDIVDDGTLPGYRGSGNYDDEGIPAQKTYMVKDGVLNSYLHDRISAAFYGVPPTGNGRRESFRYNPIPRMRSTYMENGSDGTLQDLISSVKKGIYVSQFSNGQVKIGEGDFTFYVKSGALIENGRLTMPVKDINIIGNGPEALADIVAVAGDLEVDRGTWTCGKEQSVAVSCGMPSVIVRKLTVGGE